MQSAAIPMKVLTEQVAEAIDGRRVRSAVFTTFSFDPRFFELNILPVLFDQPFSQPDKVRSLQLEDALRMVDHLAVYYDRRALAQDGEPAQLDYRRLDVSRSTGYLLRNRPTRWAQLPCTRSVAISDRRAKCARRTLKLRGDPGSPDLWPVTVR